MNGPARYQPERYIHAGPVVIVPARIAAKLERMCRLADHRAAVRGDDAELDAVLNAFHHAALWHAGSTATGTNQATPAEPAPRSLSTRETADMHGITDRAVRKALAEGRLNGHRIGTRWAIDRQDARAYREAQ